MVDISKKDLIYNAKLEKARRSFWYYCKLKAPDFYMESRPFLKEICDSMEDFYYNDNEILTINLPPRHGKSRTATLFVQWILGKDPSLKIMTGSYNETLSTTFSRQVRDSIQEIKADDTKIVYSDIFPKTNIKYGDASANLWSLEGNDYKNYLATSPTGTATGFGADLLLIDDLIKSAREANNSKVLADHWDWFTNTMLSRREGKRKVIIIMTRWSSKDLAGRALKHFESIGAKIQRLEMSAEKEDGTMLCEEILDKKTCSTLKQTLGEDIFSANYNQKPIDLKGRLYTNLMTYETLPKNVTGLYNYTDTADKGADYLCSIDYVVGADGLAYIIDVYYTQEDMTITEPYVANMVTKDNVNIVRVEANNGGHGFSRSVERISRTLGNRHSLFRPFTQSKNKESRILTGSTGVMQNILFPKNWKQLYPKFYEDVTNYQRVGKNEHDDAVDTITGIYEYLAKDSQKNGGFGW